MDTSTCAQYAVNTRSAAAKPLTELAGRRFPCDLIRPCWCFLLRRSRACRPTRCRPKCMRVQSSATAASTHLATTTLSLSRARQLHALYCSVSLQLLIPLAFVGIAQAALAVGRSDLATMGFFPAFKRNQSGAGTSMPMEVDDQYERTVSLFPTKVEPQAQDPGADSRPDFKKFGAWSFSHTRPTPAEVRTHFS